MTASLFADPKRTKKGGISVRSVPVADGVRVSPTMADGSSIRLLVSFHFARKHDLDALFFKRFGDTPPRLFADSGGFSAFTQGAAVDVHEYIAWIKRWHHLFDTYANLDVIGDSRGTARNQAIMEDAGLSPLPVFHTGESWDVLHRMVERYPYVALGGMVPYTRRADVLLRWAIRCFKIADQKTVFHGFGLTSWRVLRSLPWYSFDSTTWKISASVGEVQLFDAVAGRLTARIELDDREGLLRYRDQFRALGIDASRLGNRARLSRNELIAVMLRAQLDQERWLRQRWVVTRPDQPSETGPRLYLADAPPFMDIVRSLDYFSRVDRVRGVKPRTQEDS
jgi:hypothetical protein